MCGKKKYVYISRAHLEMKIIYQGSFTDRLRQKLYFLFPYLRGYPVVQGQNLVSFLAVSCKIPLYFLQITMLVL